MGKLIHLKNSLRGYFSFLSKLLCVGGTKIDVKPSFSAYDPSFASLATTINFSRSGQHWQTGLVRQRGGGGTHRFAKESSIAVFGVLAKIQRAGGNDRIRTRNSEVSLRGERERKTSVWNEREMREKDWWHLNFCLGIWEQSGGRQIEKKDRHRKLYDKQREVD